MAIILPAQPASAHYFYTNASRLMDDTRVDFGSDEDNNDHHMFWNHFMHYQMFDQYSARTDLNAVEQCKGCWNDGTDVVWFATVIPKTADGTQPLADWVCRSWTTFSGRCDRGRLRFHEPLTRTISGAAGFAIACHEIGHATGAQHLDDGGCMRSWMDVNDPFTNHVSNHVIEHINLTY
jgi:hypothetical protein